MKAKKKIIYLRPSAKLSSTREQVFTLQLSTFHSINR